jgi:hypothetical protein
MIHAFRDNGALANACAIEVLATKADVTRTRIDAPEQSKFLDDYERQIVDEFEKDGAAVGFHRICALPKSDVTVGYIGLEDVVTRWTAPDPLPDTIQPPVAGAIRQFDRLLSRG